MKQSFDVLVAGGGPAGSVVALDLSRRGLQVALIEQSAYENFRVGETLPPEIRKLLTELGVWERFLASDSVESYGIRSAWETPVARHHDFLYNPYGCGWHVDLGIYKTIETGLRSSAAIARSFEGDPSGMVEYENWTAEGFRSYLSIRCQFYRSVERWPRSRFWIRRMAIA